MILVYDLGGGTFDVSIIKISKGSSFEVQAVAGDDHLGGEDFDNRLVNHFAEEFKRQFQSDLTKSSRSLQRLRTGCERVKRTLSSTMEATIEIDTLYDGQDFHSTITRARFERLCMDLFDSTMVPVKKALADANLKKQQIDEIVMVGGSTRIPQIQNLVAIFFNDKKINFTINPDEAVAYGAAVQAAILADVYCSQVQNLQLFDVVPLSLGIKLENETLAKIIEKNSRVPCKKTKLFKTAQDYQVSIPIDIYEGERIKADDNYFLGKFNISGLTSALRGITQIDVTFDLDADGILTVIAKEVGKNNQNEIKINKKNGRLSSADVRRMLADAKKFRAIDEKFKEITDAKHHLEKCILQYERAVAYNPPDKKAKIQKICFEASRWLDANQEAEKVEIEQKLQNLKTDVDGLIPKIDI
jgi:heat shock 70kDa protein 1/2/6/8